MRLAKVKATDMLIAKGYEQVRDTMRQEISFQQAHVRVLAGLPVITEETRNEHGHPVFRYFADLAAEVKRLRVVLMQIRAVCEDNPSMATNFIDEVARVALLE